ncbi:nicotinamide/nicotinic acid mononucleotide adenylyltransferase 3 isoform X2 [Exaiptasia diaphana]|uniref:Cytidyltransferase-like domain-containing protein n=1 Tax=Exaiptasia diaphana TaxID=2652724 RepID=A0A913XA03_EXADI|nr:nicotinamide/nicotinic acid mononucleotide adenylyltransferase 3 isoform X2 [Exaiptasia diaphana]
MAGLHKSCQPVKVILLSCGSFNPVTHMHLRLFEIARDALHRTGLFKVLEGVISPVNDAYEKKGLLPSKHRLAMCKLAIKTSDWISVNDWEVNQDGWSKTADVLDYMTDKYSKKYSENVKVKLLCGGDLLESFAVPDLWSDEHIKKIVSENGIVVINRYGSNPEQFIYNSDVLTENKNCSTAPGKCQVPASRLSP